MLNSLSEQGRFWAAWLRNPAKVGAIAPSSKGLCNAMLNGLKNIPDDSNVVELGPGTGVVTAQLLNRFHPRQLFLLERDTGLAGQLQARWPELTVLNVSAETLPECLPENTLVGGTISSLPLLNFPTALRLAIVEQCFSVSTEQAPLVQFSYGANSPVTDDICKQLNLRVERLQKIWLNAPPATVWRYTRN